jgi:hypothetical protein
VISGVEFFGQSILCSPLAKWRVRGKNIERFGVGKYLIRLCPPVDESKNRLHAFPEGLELVFRLFSKLPFVRNILSIGWTKAGLLAVARFFFRNFAHWP